MWLNRFSFLLDLVVVGKEHKDCHSDDTNQEASGGEQGPDCVQDDENGHA